MRYIFILLLFLSAINGIRKFKYMDSIFDNRLVPAACFLYAGAVYVLYIIIYRENDITVTKHAVGLGLIMIILSIPFIGYLIISLYKGIKKN